MMETNYASPNVNMRARAQLQLEMSWHGIADAVVEIGATASRVTMTVSDSELVLRVPVGVALGFGCTLRDSAWLD